MCLILQYLFSLNYMTVSQNRTAVSSMISVHLLLVARTWYAVAFSIGLKVFPIKKKNVHVGGLSIDSVS